jgi:hypothetical protein
MNMRDDESGSRDRDELLARVLALPAADRAFFADQIDQAYTNSPDAFHGPLVSEQLAHAWAKEVERRIALIEQGVVSPVPADSALREAREHLKRLRAGRAAS